LSLIFAICINNEKGKLPCRVNAIYITYDWILFLFLDFWDSVYSSLDKKGGRRFHLSCIFLLYKRCHHFQQSRLTIPTQVFRTTDLHRTVSNTQQKFLF
jgi:hypothetical protein